MIENSEDIVLMNPEVFKAQYNIDARVNSEVVKINRESNSITVKNVLTGEKTEEKYDKLVLAPGAKAIMPRSIEGIDSENVFKVKNVVDIEALTAFVEVNQV